MERILLGHGSGGAMMHELVSTHFSPEFRIEGISDAALLDIGGCPRLALTTDSYVVSPLFFSGGDIGSLSVYGTVNDLSVAGARPLYLTAGFIIEEGFALEDLKRIVSSMARAAEAAGVSIVSGDTKVVERGKGDGIYINTSGVGVIEGGVSLSAGGIRPGDKIILSGPVASHGVAVMAGRNGLSFDPPVTSDSAPLNGLAGLLLENPGSVRVMRDPTRGGLATTLNEFALGSGLCMRVAEALIPVEPGVSGACELLGLDPLYVANEGVLVAVTSPDMAEYFVSSLRSLPLGSRAAMIGEAAVSPRATALLETSVGATRTLQMLRGEQLPRIC